MNKRERLERTLEGETVDRVPVALWRHWPGDDQRSADFARSILHFQHTFDWDFIKITPASTYSVTDYGLSTVWRGDTSGDRATVKYKVTRSLEWTELRTLDPSRGEMAKQLASIQMLDEALRLEDVPYIVTIYSPLTQAAMIAEGNLMLRNMRSHPDRLQTGLNIITESILRFVDALKRTGVVGVYYVARHADYNLMSDEEYQHFALPYDRKILDLLPSKWWLNILGFENEAPMFGTMADTTPVKVMNWGFGEVKPTLDKARSLFRGVFCGGLSAEQHLHLGTPAVVRDVARERIASMGGTNLILSAGGPVPVTAPLSNLHALREVVDKVGGS